MKPIKICDLNILDSEKAGLTIAIQGSTAAHIAVAMDVSLPTTYQRIRIWEAKGWITRVKRRKSPDGIQLNEKKVIP